VRAHESPSGWQYPKECCHQLDCAPITDSSFTKPTNPTELPQLVVTTKHGTVAVPHNFKFRKSGDSNPHACMRPDGMGGLMLICLFFPDGM
jgi:hypothetical protein